MSHVGRRTGMHAVLVALGGTAMEGLLGKTGIMKLRDPVQFAIEVGNYRLFPSLAPYIAVMLPGIEVACGLGAVIAPLRWRRLQQHSGILRILHSRRRPGRLFPT
jgi:hypothetical protein